ncbi:MAG: VCBS domain-containing protein, partial [Cyanobacteria bacterium]|nr:VCBS domain-containing protein [Cyanobacteriota bacterium]
DPDSAQSVTFTPANLVGTYGTFTIAADGTWSYVGNGAPSRNITLSLNGGAPVLVFIVPTNTATKVFRVNTDTTGRHTATGAAVANSITALGTNQITVGTALNANGVTYDVWAIKTGQVTP